VGERHGSKRTACLDKHRAARGQLESALAAECGQRDGAHRHRESVPFPPPFHEQVGKHEAEQRRIDSGKSAISRELRLGDPYTRRDHRCRQAAREQKSASRDAFDHRAEQDEREQVPAKVIVTEVCKVGGEESPCLPVRHGGAVEFQEVAERWNEVNRDRERGEHQRGEGKAFHRGKNIAKMDGDLRAPSVWIS